MGAGEHTQGVAALKSETPGSPSLRLGKIQEASFALSTLPHFVEVLGGFHPRDIAIVITLSLFMSTARKRVARRVIWMLQSRILAKQGQRDRTDDAEESSLPVSRGLATGPTTRIARVELRIQKRRRAASLAVGDSRLWPFVIHLFRTASNPVCALAQTRSTDSPGSHQRLASAPLWSSRERGDGRLVHPPLAATGHWRLLRFPRSDRRRRPRARRSPAAPPRSRPRARVRDGHLRP